MHLTTLCVLTTAAVTKESVTRSVRPCRTFSPVLATVKDVEMSQEQGKLCKSPKLIKAALDDLFQRCDSGDLR